MFEDKEKFELRNPEPDEELAEEPRLLTEESSFGLQKKGTGFRPARLFLGFLIILIGCLFLAQNLGWLKLNNYLEWAKLWPVMIVFVGLSMINLRGRLGMAIGILIALGLLALVLWIALSPKF